MPNNQFDFEMRADDKVSASIIAINEAVEKMLPKLDKTRDALALGGDETSENLDKFSEKFATLSKNAKDSVQFIGDIVPPLKMVTGLSVGLGGAATLVNMAFNEVKQFGESGYHISNQSKNISMTARAYQELTGAMIENGVARESAEQGISQLYGRATGALNNDDNEFVALLNQMGVKIKVTRDGVADVNALVDDLRNSMSKLNPAKQAFFASKLGVSDDMLNYLRLTTDQVQKLKDQAQRDGLIFSDEDIANALSFKNQVNQAGAAMDGLKLKTESWLGQTEMMKNFFEGINQLAGHGMDSVTFGQMMMWNNGGSQADYLRRAQNDEAFKKTLSFDDKISLSLGYASDSLRDKLDKWYTPLDNTMPAALQLGSDINAITNPAYIPPSFNGTGNYNQKKNNSIGFRNNNPGNLRHAPNAIGSDGGFVKFNSDDDGLAALSRQLQLYGDRGNNSLYGIIHTYAPRSENITQDYINDVSSRTGFSPSQHLDLHDPATLSKVMAAIISHENGAQPYSQEQINQAITDSITDRRWQGLRDPYYLNQQLSGMEGADSASNSSITNDTSGLDRAADKIASAVKDATKDSKSEIEITLVNQQTGERKTLTATGGRVTTSMNY